MSTNKYNMTEKVKALVRGLDGERKRDFTLSMYDRPLFNTASYWNGGSRDYFVVINIANGVRTTPPAGTFPSFADARYTLKAGEILMQTGLCMGKPMSPRFHCLPEDNNKARLFLGLPIQLSGNSVVVEIERETEVITVDNGAKILA